MLILNELPTTIIADIVMNGLNPRLYINFVECLPPEICLKILGYLDPVSLIHVAMCCRGWYDLALDRKLWERLFYLEGWKAIPSEIIVKTDFVLITRRIVKNPLSLNRNVIRSCALWCGADVGVVDAGVVAPFFGGALSRRRVVVVVFFVGGSLVSEGGETHC